MSDTITSSLHYNSDDDDVFMEGPYQDGSIMSKALAKSAVNTLKAEASKMQPRRSSLFEVPANFRPGPSGSSVMSFACEPKLDDDSQFQAHKQKKVQYENTYLMEPPAKFKADKARAIIKEVLTTHLIDQTYDPIMCSIMSKSISQEIKDKVKQLEFKRYKIVSLVTIGEKKDQDIKMGSRCIWDTTWDTYASETFENPSIYAIGIVYALYYE